MPQPTRFICCLVASSTLCLCEPSRRAPTGCGCMRERTTKASWWSWAKTAPASRTASTWVRSAPSTCWRDAGSSMRCPTTRGGSTCWGPKNIGGTTTGEPWMLRQAPCGGWWIYTKIGSHYYFLSLEPNKVFSLYCWQLLTSVFLSWCADWFTCKGSLLKAEEWIGGEGSLLEALQGRMSVERAQKWGWREEEACLKKGGQRRKMGEGDWWGGKHSLERLEKQHFRGFLLTQQVSGSHSRSQMKSEEKPTWQKSWLGYIRNCRIVCFRAQYYITDVNAAIGHCHIFGRVKDPPSFSKMAPDPGALLGQYIPWAKPYMKCS